MFSTVVSTGVHRRMMHDTWWIQFWMSIQIRSLVYGLIIKIMALVHFTYYYFSLQTKRWNQLNMLNWNYISFEVFAISLIRFKMWANRWNGTQMDWMAAQDDVKKARKRNICAISEWKSMQEKRTIRRQIKRRKAASIQRYKHIRICMAYSVQLPKFHLNLFFNEMHNKHAKRTQNVSGSNDKCVFSTHTKSNQWQETEKKTGKKEIRQNRVSKITRAHTAFSPYASIFSMVSISNCIFQSDLYHPHRQYKCFPANFEIRNRTHIFCLVCLSITNILI